MKAHTRHVINVFVVLLVLAVGTGAYAWSGLYNVGADDPHWSATRGLLTTLREHSIEARTNGIAVPSLKDPQLILKGAGQYSAMCVSCHLAPGVEDSELRHGLYPQPPNLTEVHVAPRVAFWVIKHGIKMSAMPAWGSSHDARTIWSMVAFLQELPKLTPAEYKAIVAKAPPDED